MLTPLTPLTPHLELPNRIPLQRSTQAGSGLERIISLEFIKKYKRILSMTPLTFGGSGKRNSTEFP
jgi:hypothetical protein